MDYFRNIDKKKIRLLAFDLDGTLLDPTSHVTQRTRDALVRASEAGYVLALATGRVYTSFPSDIAEIPVLDYAVSSNGAHIVDLKTGSTVYESLIPEAAVRRIMGVLTAPDIMTEVFFDHNAYMSRHCAEHFEEYGILTDKRKNYMLTTRRQVEDIGQLLEEHIAGLENLKLDFGDYDRQLAVSAELAKDPDLTVVCYQHLGLGVEISGSATSKASALRELCSMLGFTADDMMVFGDSNNDVHMMEAAGVSVAMGNATDNVKEIADIVCPSNEEDGIVDIIDELLAE
ncbi:MAG: Cof-type HAD-IIB family hydrolase [Firmicutes bacterium]|nr:Cof-type HAD-IIB family hydrolase [Bacillota bacterium]MBQ3579068.1 Cof-type HAD-IIB family hydrolase [Bacillota bacterium]MBQ4234063.1 Cof-type HAD-IIB family hydrolase [Bacillota bacterium]MBQ6012507.1 Cof-type HAD-IIB family hydrolase [Bacillota bacterium]MBQ6259687.1 Cof-type HAD-IIB family hydrolase [Bacillota bacterium]